MNKNWEGLVREARRLGFPIKQFALKPAAYITTGCDVVLAMADEIERLQRIVTHPDRPRVVCLCGSTRFVDAWVAANRSETLAGRIVLSVGMFGHQEGIDMEGPVKAGLDQLHFRKIELADEILVLNVDGYVGSSTRNEIAHACRLGKPIRWLEPDRIPPDCAGEVAP